MWVRGLKLTACKMEERCQYVAPYVGAWIETHNLSRDCNTTFSRTLCGCVD